MAEDRNRSEKMVDGSRLIRAGLRTGDTETRAAGWKVLRKLWPGNKVRKVYNALREEEKISRS